MTAAPTAPAAANGARLGLELLAGDGPAGVSPAPIAPKGARARRRRVRLVDGEHGTDACYQSGCSCLSCLEAHRFAHARYVVRRARTGAVCEPVADTQRRLEDLKECGVANQVVAERMGVCVETVLKHRNGRRRRIRKEMAEAVLELWEQHCGSGSGQDQVAAQQARDAEIQGWLRDLQKRGVSNQVIAARVGVSVSTVVANRSGRRQRIRTEFADGVRELWEDHCQPVKAERRWEVGPLRDKLVARYGSMQAVGSPAQVRTLYRAETLRESTAERYALSHGWLPHEVWPAWYEVEEVAS